MTAEDHQALGHLVAILGIGGVVLDPQHQLAELGFRPFLLEIGVALPKLRVRWVAAEVFLQ